MGVSTHSRPKAAGAVAPIIAVAIGFQHTAARRRLDTGKVSELLEGKVSTHSRPKAAGSLSLISNLSEKVSTHSRPKAAGSTHNKGLAFDMAFQHTAARRRLDTGKVSELLEGKVSTHSRPKAAGSLSLISNLSEKVSTHSRPKAAGSTHNKGLAFDMAFQHTAARRRLG